MNKIYISGYYVGNSPFNYEIRPSQIQATTNTIGDEERAVDGTLNKFHIAYKKTWKLSFSNVSSGIANTLEVIFTTPNQFNFTDERGNSYNVYCDKDSFSRTLSAENVSLQGIPVYSVELGLVEI